jgi:uncharacterized protein YuzE
MDLVLRYDPKAGILALKLREGEIVDERLLDSARGEECAQAWS